MGLAHALYLSNPPYTGWEPSEFMTLPSGQDLHTIHPGDWYFGAEYQRLHTLLGSCVALTAWHPQLKIGGLCHYLLPASPYDHSPQEPRNKSESDCRYADNALAAMKFAMLQYAQLKEFHIAVFGGGDMFAFNSPTSIGYDNIRYARQWLQREQIQPYRVDVGGTISRSLTLIVATGEIHVKHYQMNAG